MLDTELILAAQKMSRLLKSVLHGLADCTAGYEWLAGALQLPRINGLRVQVAGQCHCAHAWCGIMGDAGRGLQRSGKSAVAALRIARALLCLCGMAVSRESHAANA